MSRSSSTVMTVLASASSASMSVSATTRATAKSGETTLRSASGTVGSPSTCLSFRFLRPPTSSLMNSVKTSLSWPGISHASLPGST